MHVFDFRLMMTALWVYLVNGLSFPPLRSSRLDVMNSCSYLQTVIGFVFALANYDFIIPLRLHESSRHYVNWALGSVTSFHVPYLDMNEQ